MATNSTPLLLILIPCGTRQEHYRPTATPPEAAAARYSIGRARACDDASSKIPESSTAKSIFLKREPFAARRMRRCETNARVRERVFCDVMSLQLFCSRRQRLTQYQKNALSAISSNAAARTEFSFIAAQASDTDCPRPRARLSRPGRYAYQ